MQVYDLFTGATVNNANVQVASDDNQINRTYTVTVSHLNYRTRTLRGIILRRDATTYCDVYLTRTLQTVGRISGTVRNAMNGQPIANAYVSVTLNNRSVWTFTDSAGQYTTDNLPRATYTVLADARNYHSQRVSAAVVPNQTTTADLVLTPLSEPVGNLYGHTYDIISGNNVNNATVTLISDLGWSLTVSTGNGNYYSWENLPVRTRYKLAAAAEGYRSTNRVNIELSTAYDTRVDLFLPSAGTPAANLSGRVYDIRTGNPISNAFVQLTHQGRPVSVFANEQGVFQFNGLVPTSYDLYAWHPNYNDQVLNNVPLRAGDSSADILLTADGTPVGGFEFYGYNFATGGAVNNVRIRITAPSGHSMTTYSGAGSYYEFVSNLPVGVPLRIEAFAPGFRSRLYANRYVRLGRTDRINIWFVPEDINVGRLTGRVTDLFTGAGIANAYVFMEQVGTGRWAPTYTDASGNFTIDELFPTTYNVSIGAPGYYESVAYNVPIAIGDNAIEFALTPYNYPSGRLYGDVVNAANNQGINNAVVLLISSTGTTRITYTGNGSRFDFDNLAYDQRYTLVGQAAGFQPGQVSNVEVPAFGEVYVRLPLNAGSGGLIGRIVLQGFTGNPAGRVQARVQIRSGNQLVREATVTLGDSGAFVVPNVPNGTYNIWIKPRGWLASLTNGITIPNLLPIAFLSGAHGDVNDDNVINNADLLEILFNFGQSGSNLAADLNYDGSVNNADLLIVLFNFGQQGPP
ncbi:MAG: carboxypeptidase regulatory-like domain-containing protein [Fimbriimonadales bacterium]|nr:carboxypeptidase regulatory-like domain-containing protein [Fimbriimonadales bacterium]MDW8051370.1 carboxypeptidase regulatory-like domain-containing protein [Armatimonadota bacterium]